VGEGGFLQVLWGADGWPDQKMAKDLRKGFGDGRWGEGQQMVWPGSDGREWSMAQRIKLFE